MFYTLTFLLKHTFWAWPSLLCIASIVLAWILCGIEIQQSNYETMRPDMHFYYVFFFTGTVSGAQSMISTVSSFSVSVVTLTFSLTVLSLQLAAQSYSPRILNEFVKDSHTKITLGIYLGTYCYCYIVSMNIRAETSTQPAYIPIVAVNAVFLFGIVMLSTFVLFLDYFVDSLRMESVLQRAVIAGESVCEMFLPIADKSPKTVLPPIPKRAIRIDCLGSGYVVGWKPDTILDDLHMHGMFLFLSCFPFLYYYYNSLPC